MHLVDLTHTFTNDMPVYPGDPKAELRPAATAANNGYNAWEIHAGLHTGTHLDAPFHMMDTGEYVSDIHPDRLVGQGHLIDARDAQSITKELVEDVSILPGDILLLRTDRSVHFGTDVYYKDYPLFTEEAAEKLVELGVSAVGMDTPSPDHNPFPVHHILLSKGVLIMENLTNLHELENAEAFQVLALPPKLQTDAAPVRVVALVE